MSDLVILDPDLMDAQALSEQILALSEQILDTAQTVAVRTQEDFAGCAAFLAKIKGAFRALEEKRRGIVDPINLVIRRINDLFLAPKQQLQFAESLVKAAMARYSDEQQRGAKEEEARLRRLAEEENARRLKRAETEATRQERKGNVGLAETILQEAQASLVPPPVLRAEAPKAMGVSIRTTWKFRITDEALIPREYLVPDERKIGGVVRSLQDKASIPGVEVYAETSVASASER